MSDLSFARPLCERLAKACPDQFQFLQCKPLNAVPTIDLQWQCNDTKNEATVFHGSISAELYAFFGPLADERTINGDTITGCEKAPSGRYTSCILESLMVAVVESYEAEGK